MAHKDRSHAELSASGSSIWLNCTMSPVLSRGVERRSSKYADEGTAAHEVAEELLRQRGFGKPKAYSVDEEAEKWVTPYVDYVEALFRTAPLYQIEQRVSLAKLWEGNPPSDLFGTADCVVITPDRTMHVVDLKYGKGVSVEVKDNSQLLYYALGAWLMVGDKLQIENVRMTIVQPRAAHPDGPVRHWDLPLVDVIHWGYEVLKPTVDLICEDDPSKLTLVEGKHCRWCPAALAGCPEKQKTKTNEAKTEFGL